MTAIRLARGFTGRSVIVKFAGCYHGHVDSLLAAAGSGVATFGAARLGRRPGRCRGRDHRAALQRPRRRRGRLRRARRRDRRRHHRGRRRQHGRRPARARLHRGAAAGSPTRTARCSISDEVMTGFRCSRSGWYGLEGPYAGRRPRPVHLRQGHGRRLPGRGLRRPRGRSWRCSSPQRAGLPGGHPLGEPGRHRRRPRDPAAAAPPRSTPASTRSATPSLRRVDEPSRRDGVPHTIQWAGSMFSVFFRDQRGRRLRRRQGAVTEAFAAFFHAMLRRGVHLPPARSRRGSSAPPTTTRPSRPCSRPPTARPGRRRGVCDNRAMSQPPIARSSTSCGTARSTTPSGVLYGRLPGFQLSALGRQMAETVARLPRRPRRHPRRRLAPRAGAGDRRAHRRGARAARRRPTTGSSRPTTSSRARRFGVGDGAAPKPADWRYLVNPLHPQLGRAVRGDRRADAGRHRRRPRQAAEGHEAVLVSHQLPVWTVRAGSRDAPLARPAQARVLARLAHLLDVCR